MEIIVKVGGRWKNDKKAHALFEMYKIHTERRIEQLSKHFHVRLPCQLNLKPLYTKDGFSHYAGRIKYGFMTGWLILIDPEAALRTKGKYIDILDHEISHMITALKFKDWSHGERFQQVFYYCCITDCTKQKRRKK